MKQHTLITKLLISINISNKIFLIFLKMTKYKPREKCILHFVIQDKNIFFGKKHTHWHYLGFIKELDFREAPFTTLKLLHRVLLKH